MRESDRSGSQSSDRRLLEAERANTKRLQNGCVIWADDNADMRECVTRLLQQSGFDVIAVRDGREAVEAARANLPDLVLSDIMMPRLDGFGMLRELRNDPSTAAIPVILLSARAGEEARVEGMQAGADDYLIKPFSAKELIARVESHVRMARFRRESSQALRESEERYRQTLSLMPAAVYTCDASGTITFFNQRAAQLWGRAPKIGDADVRFCGSEQLLLPDGTPLPHEKCPMAVALREGRSYRDAEVKIRQPDGSLVEVLVNIDPIRNEMGEVVAAINVFHDVSAIKQAERSLRESEERYRSLVSVITDVPWTTDAQGAFVTDQPAWAAYTGQSQNELRGFGWIDALHPDDRQSVVALWKQARESRSLYESRGRLWHAATSKYRHFIARATPLFADNGQRPAQVREWVGTCTDVEEQHRAEAALRESEARLESELADTRLLQDISAAMIQNDNVEAIYEQIMDAAVAIMRSQFASMQMLYPERGEAGELLLLAHHGFDAQAAKTWEWVSTKSSCTCGLALKTGERFIASDVATCKAMAGTADQANLQKAGIRAAQSTPLVSRSGQLIGMITTHWSQPHEPSERDLRLMDILARQAADLIERKKAERTLRESEDRFRRIFNFSNDAIFVVDPSTDAILDVNERACRMLGYTREELLAQPISAIHPDEMPALMAFAHRP